MENATTQPKKPNVIFGNEKVDVIQYGYLGVQQEAKGGAGGRYAALDLNTVLSGFLCALQGYGKSYVLGCLIEMFIQAIEGVNRLPYPGCSTIFHCSQDESYKPEWPTMIFPNGNARSRAHSG